MNAIVIVDKPSGMTSAEVVRRVKRVVRPARVGHLGTLDPFATGVLPVLIGEATKLAHFMEGGDKRYQGLIALGTETDTLDREGEVVRTAEVPPLDRERLAEIERRFTGKITQVPPVFSAIKRAGVPLYRLARQGVEIEPPEPREVEIRLLKLEAAARDSIRLEAVCSPGTYIRSLARDIGIALGSAAHLAELRRLWTAGYSIEDASPLEAVLQALESGDWKYARLLDLAEAMPGLPCAKLDPVLEKRLRNGDSSALDLMVPAGAGIFKVLSLAGNLIAIARATSRTTAAIERIFNS